ncbi:hypothetical protein F5B22DRAFT_119234 [Xylaria bambusicola]|uniref:uncharacterized protein n=1 Tax=Xylaria bambusicola TaxID=326684 RepID=UPI00200801DB|nr:uncharacterized protein F5B22DRAFT_119234 [Xylaria bambusicola]KAI0517346.1 hypothetical protein F5B22DRAFT_119234 [Xylaria bambusicola]
MSKPPSVSGGHNDPKTPPKVITRRRGACRSCKHKKIRCNGGTPCSACDRIGSTCHYEPRSRKTSDTRELSLPAPVSNRPEHDRDRPPSSTESDGLEDTSGPQSLSLVGSSPAMFSLDTNIDFLFPSGTFSFPTPTEDLAISQPRDYPAAEGILGAQYPINDSAISSSTMPLELETGRSTATDSACTLSSPWTTLERRITKVADHIIQPLKGLPEYCRVDANIDYRLTTSFGLAELPAPQRDSRKHLETCRILRSLTKSHFPANIPKQNIMHGTVSLTKNAHDGIIQRCVEACFKNNVEIPTFLRKTDVVKKISEVRESSHPDVLLSLFSDAIITIGLNVLRNPAELEGLPSIDSQEYAHSHLDALANLQGLPSSLLKLQTIILLSIIASSINDSRLCEILSIGVNCVRELQYTNSVIVRRTFTNVEDQRLVKRSVWVLYYLETTFSVLRGLPPLLHSDFIDHLPTEPNHPEEDTLIIQVAAASLLARSLSRVYTRPVSAKTTEELQACISDLVRWRGCLSDPTKQLTAGRGFEKRLCGDEDAGAKLQIFCSYHECVYLLFAPWLKPLVESISPPQSSPIRDGDTLLNMDVGAESATDRRVVLVDTLEKCLESAYTIVSHANEIVSLDKTLARRLRGLMIISVCVITYGIQYGDADTKKESLTYLGICCGTFGGMYLGDSSLPFEEILDLVRIIRSDS